MGAPGGAGRERPSPSLPFVSVVMPVYNGARYVAAAIDSVLAQTYPAFELIVIDDGSTDRTWDLLQTAAARDTRIRVFTQTNQDQPATLNRGLALARYEWVAILDHDDLCLPQRLERQVQTLASYPAVRVLGTYGVQIDARGAVIGPVEIGPTTPEAWARIRAQGGEVNLLHPSVMLHRPTVLRLGGYDPAFGPAADTELWSRVADEHLVLVVPEPLVCYRSHGASMSSTRFFEQRAMLRWLKAREQARRAGQAIPTLEEHRAMSSSWIGLDWLHCGRIDRAEYSLRQARVCWQTQRYLQAAGLLLGAVTLAPGYAVRRARAHRRRQHSFHDPPLNIIRSIRRFPGSGSA